MKLVQLHEIIKEKIQASRYRKLSPLSYCMKIKLRKFRFAKSITLFLSCRNMCQFYHNIFVLQNQRNDRPL